MHASWLPDYLWVILLLYSGFSIVGMDSDMNMLYIDIYFYNSCNENGESTRASPERAVVPHHHKYRTCLRSTRIQIACICLYGLRANNIIHQEKLNEAVIVLNKTLQVSRPI